MDNNFNKALELSRKTGDRLIIFDSSGKVDPFVVMPIDEYEQLVAIDEPVADLTEEQLIDKINCDIANWKAQKEESRIDRPKSSNIGDDYRKFDYDFDDEIYGDAPIDRISGKFEENSGNYQPEDDLYQFENVKKSAGKGKSHWRIPSERKEAAEEVIEEDRHYLEEVPF